MTSEQTHHSGGITISGTGPGAWVRASLRGRYAVDGTDDLPAPADGMVTVKLSWRVGDPYAVGITLELARSVSLAIFVDRALLADGLRQVYGLSSRVPFDVRQLAHVTTHPLDEAHVLTAWRYRSSDPLRVLLLDAADLAAFLSTLAGLVPPGTESAQADWAEELRQLVRDEHDVATCR